MAQQNTDDARTADEYTVKFSGATRTMAEQEAQAAFTGSDEALAALDRYSTVVAVRTPEEANEVISVLDMLREDPNDELQASQASALRRVRRSLVDVLPALREQEQDSQEQDSQEQAQEDEDADSEDTEDTEDDQEQADSQQQAADTSADEQAASTEDTADSQEQATSAALAGDLLERDPAEYGYTAKLQMTETQVAVCEAALEAPSATQETVAEAAGCTERYANSTLNRWRGTEDEREAVAADVAPCYQD